MIPAIGTAQWYKVIIAAAERNTQGKTLQNYCETLYSQRHPEWRRSIHMPDASMRQ
jgi:hypothetical protein